MSLSELGNDSRAVVLTVLFGLIASFIPALPFMGIGSLIDALKAPVSAALTSAELMYPAVAKAATGTVVNVFQRMALRTWARCMKLSRPVFHN